MLAPCETILLKNNLTDIYDNTGQLIAFSNYALYPSGGSPRAPFADDNSQRCFGAKNPV